MLNRVIMIGNLTEDPELKYTPNGTAVGRLRLAVSRTYNRDETDFFTVVAWRGTAELCANYLKKGSQVGIEGRLQTRSYDGKDGQKRWVTEIIADNVHFLGGRRDSADSKRGNAAGGNDSMAEFEKLGREIKAEDLDTFDAGMSDDEIPF